MLTELIDPIDTLLDKEFEGRHRTERVLNSEVSYVWYLIGWFAKTFDYINRVPCCYIIILGCFIIIL